MNGSSYRRTKQAQKNQCANLSPSNLANLGSKLPVEGGLFTDVEIIIALKCLSSGKAAGGDEIPPELWKLLSSEVEGVGQLLGLCNACWEQKSIPDKWREATVVLLFKKGDVSVPENYRPISLLSIGYKVLALMIQKRLQIPATEARIRNTQYGFRPKRGTVAAISIVRRISMRHMPRKIQE